MVQTLCFGYFLRKRALWFAHSIVLFSVMRATHSHGKSIWQPKVPSRISFFVWVAVLGKILTAENLRKRHIILVSWCCLFKRDGETVDHLLLHCPFSWEVWDMVFALFGVQWVMLEKIIDLLACW
jgi:hypothetical protein